MANVYLALFVIGFALTALSFVSGAAGHSVGHVADIFGHGDVGSHGGLHGAGHGGAGGQVPFLNFGTLTAFMTWFGGIGYLLTVYSNVVVLVTIVGAVVGGLAGAGVVFVFMAKILGRDQIPLDPADYYMPGTLGRVTVTIPAHGTGEIVYTQAGTRKTVAARGDNGGEIAKGTEIVVLRFERGIAYARPWDQVDDERERPQSERPRS